MTALEEAGFEYEDQVVNIWIFFMAGTAEFDFSPYGHLTALMKNVQRRDNFQRALAREATAAEKAGLPTP